MARALLYALIKHSRLTAAEASSRALSPHNHKSKEIFTMRYAHPGTEGSLVTFKTNFAKAWSRVAKS